MNEANILDIKVIFIEDDVDVRDGSAQALELAGFHVDAYASVEEAAPHIVAGLPAVLLCDVKLPGMSGVVWLRWVRGVDQDLPVILVTGHGDIAMAVQAMREGAYDFIEKPCSAEYLIRVVRRAADRRYLALQVHELRDKLENWHGIQAVLIGRSAVMENVRRTVLMLAATSADVIIYGETGTGKELVARCLHEHSERRQGNFVPLNCGGLPEALADSELFGHESGAFTGAAKLRIGKIEHAHRGTLFLDEIESMPMAVQIKFLRVLQERCVERLGSNNPIAIDCRVVAAAKGDLKALSEQQKFRADLYYRIGVAFIEISPLRERREDIPLLFEHFVLLAASRYKCDAPPVSGALLAELMAYSWPGNVRELRNAADRFVLGLCKERLGLAQAFGESERPSSLPEQVEYFERAMISDALRRHHGDVGAAAKALGVPKPTLYDKLRRLGLSIDDYRPT